MKKRLKKQTGFTLVEVLLATAMFSFMLIAAVGGILNVLTIYAGSATSRDNQQSTSSIAEEVGRRADFAQTMYVSTLHPDRLCIDEPGQTPQVFYLAPYSLGQKLMRANLVGTAPSGVNSCDPAVVTNLDSAIDTSASAPGAIQVSADSVNVTQFAPIVLKNVPTAADLSQGAKTTISLDLSMTVKHLDITTADGQKFQNAYTLHTAFFALNQ